jgi:hypothetical protein
MDGIREFQLAFRSRVGTIDRQLPLTPLDVQSLNEIDSKTMQINGFCSGVAFIWTPCSVELSYFTEYNTQRLSRPQAYSGTGRTTRVQFPAEAIMAFFIFATASRPILGLIQSPVRWVPGDLVPGLKISVSR